MRISLTFAVLLFCLSQGWAQEDIEISKPIRTPDSVRDQHVKRFTEHFSIFPVLKQRTLSFDLERRDRSSLLNFRPNNSFTLGLGAYIFELGVSLSFAIPAGEKSKSRYGNSDARDVQLNILGKRFGVDLFYQKYSGFYITERGNEPMNGAPFPQRPDIDSRHLGITGSYIFNNRKFSFRSIYNYSERQLYSKGSFIALTSLNTFRIGADSSIISDEQQLVFGDKVSFTNLRYTTLSIAPGYTYSIIYNNFFLNGSLGIGPANHWIQYRLENGTEKNDLAVDTFVAARIGIGYNGDRLFGGITFVTQGNSVNFEDVRFANNNGSFKVLVGYRFREFGVLKKRIWDFVPLHL